MSGIFLPVFIHFCVLNILKMMGLHLDAASLMTLAALISAPVFLWMYKKDRLTREEKGWGIRLLTLREALELLVLALVCNVFLTFVVTIATDFFRLSNQVQEELYASNRIVQLIGVGLIGPIMEEVLFRGLVYRRLKDYNEGWFAVILAAALFAVYHGNPIQILFAFPMAIVIIGVYDKYQTLLAPVLFHIIVNLSSVFIEGRF